MCTFDCYNRIYNFNKKEMKKIILFLTIVLLTVSVHAQRRFKVDSILVPTGTDTTVYIRFFTGNSWGINFNYKAFDAADAILDLGVSPHADSTTFDRLDNSSLPYTMADSTVSFEKASFPFKYLVIKLTKSSVTAGTPLYYYYWKQ